MSGRTKAASVAAVLILVGVSAFRLSAQAKPPAPAEKPCSTPENRQLDFWVGDWDVQDSKTGEKLGANRIERVLSGCAIEEHWLGSNGSAGMSFSIYAASDKKWHYNWVDEHGHLLYLSGGFHAGKMVLQSEAPVTNPGEKPMWYRMTWEPAPGGRVHQLYEASPDGGKTWSLHFDGVYVAKK